MSLLFLYTMTVLHLLGLIITYLRIKKGPVKSIIISLICLFATGMLLSAIKLYRITESELISLHCFMYCLIFIYFIGTIIYIVDLRRNIHE